MQSLLSFAEQLAEYSVRFNPLVSLLSCRDHFSSVNIIIWIAQRMLRFTIGEGLFISVRVSLLLFCASAHTSATQTLAAGILA